jgi:hypothetical protein
MAAGHAGAPRFPEDRCRTTHLCDRPVAELCRSWFIVASSDGPTAGKTTLDHLVAD